MRSWGSANLGSASYTASAQPVYGGVWGSGERAEGSVGDTANETGVVLNCAGRDLLCSRQSLSALPD
ncbi:hypothetical protein EMIT0196MI5_180013 [Pseudomonas sp. IT-196MI5]